MLDEQKSRAEMTKITNPVLKLAHA